MVDQKKLEEMRRQIDEARRIEEEMLGVDNEADEAEDKGVSPRFVAKCFRLNERGDGMLYAATHRGRKIYVKKLATWLDWSGNHWKVDQGDNHINGVEEVAEHYEQYAANLKARAEELRQLERKSEAKQLDSLVDNYKRRVNKLRTLKGARTCTEYSHRIGGDSLSIIGEELDQKPLLLACPNAVIDLKTGDTVDAVPEDYLLNAVKYDWKGIDEPCPVWEEFFDQIHMGDEEIKRLVHAMLGYAVTGLRTEHFLGCFIGEGRNGKGTMFETIREILGDLAWSISPELLLEQRYNRTSAGPSPDLYSLMGRRMVIASETDEGARISTSQVKRLTGGDTIKTRAPHERYEINFRPSHKLFLYSQYPPHGLAKDYAMAKRLLYITYPLKFVDDPKEPNERKRDQNLPEKLEAEASGILAWLVRGALMWRADGGLKPPDKVRAAVDAQRKLDDVILQFFEEELERDEPDQYLNFAEVYSSFKEFYKDQISESEKFLPTKKKVSKWFNDHDCQTGKKGGAAIIYGIRLKPIGGAG